MAHGVAATVNAGDEAALDDNLCELAAMEAHGASPACRERAARLVAKHRYWERLMERETACLDTAIDGLAVALATGDADKAEDCRAQLETMSCEGVSSAHRDAARRALNRHFKTARTAFQPRV